MNQACSRKNRSPADQTFLLRGCIDHAKFMKRPVYIVLYDYSQCFDSLWLEDCLLSLWKLGVNNEILSLLRDLNKECNIIVKTPAGMTEQFTVNNIVQQGSVSGGVLCSASTGEVAEEIKAGGTQVGTCSIKVLTYVDDIAILNTIIQDVYNSHQRVVWFSKRKRLTLNAKKCVILCINLKPSDVIPRLLIDGSVVPTKNVSEYLGDHFNCKGDNNDLVEERAKKGKAAIVNSMAMCSDVTMGFHAIQTLLLLYHSLFIQVMLNNAQAWCNLTKANLQSLQTIQLKYLKRTFHAPSSTSNPLTFLETGTLPIKHEIHVRQLTFLHHIVTLELNDPVKQLYQQQLQYPAPNWANEIKEIRKWYNLTKSDVEIAEISKEVWKAEVKKKVREKALDELNCEALEQKKAQDLVPYSTFSPQNYISELSPRHARIIFHIRTGSIDLRSVRKYTYGDNTSCRLCHNEDESVEHVVNSCTELGVTLEITNIYTADCTELKKIAQRFVVFQTKIDEAEKRSV